MNIAIIINSLTGGGAERVAGYLSKYLVEKHNVFIFLENIHDVSYEYGGKLIEYREASNGHNCTLEHALPTLKRKYMIDVSISFMETTNFANIMSRCNDKIIISERSTYSQIKPRLKIIDRLISEYYNFADSIVACSYGVSQNLKEDYGVYDVNIEVIYNFVDQARIIRKSKENIESEFYEFLDGHDYFLNIGRLDSAKRQDKLIKQFKIFNDIDSHGTKLIIIGDGPLKECLISLIHDLELDDKVKIIPYSNNPFKYLKGAKAFLFTSDYEGMPNVLLEAMTLGVPIISVDCKSGPRELLSGEIDYSAEYPDVKICERGILVRKDDIEGNAFARAIEWFCNHEHECEVIRNNELIFMEKYSNDSILEQWNRVIEKENSEKKVYHNKFSCDIYVYDYIYIYGAGKIGKRLYEEYSLKHGISAFVCSSTNGMPNQIFGVDVISISAVDTPNEKTLFLVGVGEKSLDEVCDSINNAGYSNYFIPF